jgi:hypothetical protein
MAPPPRRPIHGRFRVTIKPGFETFSVKKNRGRKAASSGSDLMDFRRTMSPTGLIAVRTSIMKIWLPRISSKIKGFVSFAAHKG